MTIFLILGCVLIIATVLLLVGGGRETKKERQSKSVSYAKPQVHEEGGITSEETYQLARTTSEVVTGRKIRRAAIITIFLLIPPVLAMLAGHQEIIPLSPETRRFFTGWCSVSVLGCAAALVLMFVAELFKNESGMIWVILFFVAALIVLTGSTEYFLWAWLALQSDPRIFVPIPIFIAALAAAVCTLVIMKRYTALALLLLIIFMSSRFHFSEW
jgi:hypothetical protein